MKRKWVSLGIIWLLFSFSVAYATPEKAAEVFQMTASKIGPDSLSLHWTIKPGYFLYKDRIEVRESKDSIIHPGTISLPKATIKKDKEGTVYKIYRYALTLQIPLLAVDSGENILQVHYQGCSDDGFCYPPETKQVKVAVDKNLVLQSVEVEKGLQPSLTPENPAPVFFKKDNIVLTLLTFFGLGLLLAFTPCILPMVPVLSGIIVGHSKDLTTTKSFLLSLSYVLSMACTYALIGMLVASIGANLQVIMQAPWVIGLFSALFVMLALSMFGFFELKLPVSIQAKLAQVTRSQSNGHYMGAAIMGALSTLILSPCVTAPLIGALSFIADTGKIVIGGLALFFLGLGMGLPLLLIGLSAGKLLPKTGIWMNSVKGFFGILLLGVAIYLLSRLLPDFLIMALWAALLIFSGIFMGALRASNTKPEKFHQAIGLIMLIYGGLILIGASLGSDNPFKPLAVLTEGNIQATHGIETVKSVEEIQNQLDKTNEKPVILDFYADWCISCKVMEKTTLQDPNLQTLLKNYRLIKVDITKNDSQAKAVMEKYKVIAPPTFLFFNTEGQLLPQLTLIGEISAETFIQQLRQL